jgi:acyl-coenzyme A synthetase/AMP-(fatty) acid ligase
MLHRFDLREFDIPSLRYLTHAGGPLNLLLTKDLIRLCDNRSIAFYSMYGQAEASPRMSYLPWNNASSKMGSIGVPISGGRFWLEDKAGTIISSNNEVGQLVYQGDNVCLGYAERYSDLNKSDENNGILHTGDTAYFDAEGFYYITGRTSRFLKVYGSRVNLDEVESLLEEAGYEVACSGSDDNIKIYLTLENDTKHIIDFISAKTSLHRTVFSTHVVDFIPRAASGKIIYSELV